MGIEESIIEGDLLREHRELFTEKIEEDQRFVNAFCYGNVKLISRDLIDERGFFEPIYYFSDNLGGYTIKGIKGSLIE